MFYNQWVFVNYKREMVERIRLEMLAVILSNIYCIAQMNAHPDMLRLNHARSFLT